MDDLMEEYCPVCGESLKDVEREFECPFFGEPDTSEGFYQCPNCEEFFGYLDESWECEFCHNGEEDDEIDDVEETTVEEERNVSYCPECGEPDYDGYCSYCGYPNNQGWIGENY